ncbi:GMC family oxidoreductase [Paraburkholderia humisilvae]|uniref:Putative GMC-type oxidoreductase n=1 Tax=Paraburkholderia humisilvae TaxID=627669 RepID=A0A6J5E9R5_9BURK|nr:GMC family oxidoreductase [Paraburkholderia humisilvae]CAB3763239.1 putative GMC-type oxidoreductase [Paraburkholderia humisilvae]
MLEEYVSRHEDRVVENQNRLAADTRATYDFIVCGSGTSGSVVARRLAEQSDATVLVLEAGEMDNVPEIEVAEAWIKNLGTSRDWAFTARSNAQMNHRPIALHMGRVLGGGSSINAMHWSRGHRADWDTLAAETGDPDWSYASVLEIYKQIEDWHGVPDRQYRGTGGLVHVSHAPALSPLPYAWLTAAKTCGIPEFVSQNGTLMEAPTGASMADVCIREQRRVSIFRSYLYPMMDRPNVTVLTRALVTRVLFSGNQASGVECIVDGKLRRFNASLEVVLSLGAIHTPKVLMQSGIGGASQLHEFNIPVIEELKGVGRNFQDHWMVAGCICEAPESVEAEDLPHGAIVQANAFVHSSVAEGPPDIQLMQLGFPFASENIAGQYAIPPKSWTILPVLTRPRSTGRISLTGAGPQHPVIIEANPVAEPEELAALTRAVELANEISQSPTLKRFVKRQVTPGNLEGSSLQAFVRDSIASVSHQTCTAMMGNDPDSVVNSKLQVHGISRLTIADGSVLRNITTGNTMAPCVVIGERAAMSIRLRHQL